MGKECGEWFSVGMDTEAQNSTKKSPTFPNYKKKNPNRQNVDTASSREIIQCQQRYQKQVKQKSARLV